MRAARSALRLGSRLRFRAGCWPNHRRHYADPECDVSAYRDWEHSRFGTWANSEYSVFFAAGMVSLNEHNAGLTVGTMSLIRARALREVGGWAEWCLTEDSELAIRIHAAGAFLAAGMMAINADRALPARSAHIDAFEPSLQSEVAAA